MKWWLAQLAVWISTVLFVGLSHIDQTVHILCSAAHTVDAWRCGCLLSINVNTVLCSLSFWVDFKLFVVMIVVPIFGNIIQFWLTDTILKKKDWDEYDKTIRKQYFMENDEPSEHTLVGRSRERPLSPTLSKENLGEIESHEVSVEPLEIDDIDNDSPKIQP
jgi:STIMATE family